MVSLHRLCLALAGAAALVAPLQSVAETAEDDARRPEAASAPEPALHHSPPAVGEAHRPLRVFADIEQPQLVSRAVVVYRTAPGAAYREVEMRRSDPGPYVAEIPAQIVRWPAVEYAIELEGLDRRRTAVFATRSHPHRVEIPEDLTDVRERALLERVRGHRSVFSTRAEHVSFGSSPADVRDEQTGLVASKIVSDRYWRAEASYTYRPLRAVTEFSIRLGAVRGRSPVPGVTDEGELDVGLNYGSPSVTLRLSDWAHLRGELLTSVTEVGFSLGGGGALLVGDPYGGNLTVGFETIRVFGTRFYSRMDLVAADGVTLSPVVEITDMPHADRFGVRLLGELSVDLAGGFGFGVSGGYQARDSASGGVGGGARASYAF